MMQRGSLCLFTLDLNIVKKGHYVYLFGTRAHSGRRPNRRIRLKQPFVVRSHYANKRRSTHVRRTPGAKLPNG